jgi:hypothetical protein
MKPDLIDLKFLESEINNQFIKITHDKLWEYFVPYLRQSGIKGQITRGKLKWRGIKLKVENNLDGCRYQLNQRGVDISPVFTISFNYQLRHHL